MEDKYKGEKRKALFPQHVLLKKHFISLEQPIYLFLYKIHKPILMESVSSLVTTYPQIPTILLGIGAIIFFKLFLFKVLILFLEYDILFYSL